MCRVTNALVRFDGTLPLFGDISPDCPTPWLRGLPRMCRWAAYLEDPSRDPSNGYAAGASAFFRTPPRGDSGHSPRDAEAADWRSKLFPVGGLLFLEHPATGLEVSAHGDPRAATAAHGDTGRGSFEIWFHGRRVVVDGGVPTYGPGGERRHFRSPAGQNVIAIDGMAPTILPEDATELPRWYCDSGGGGSWQQDAATARFTWRGFGRCHPGLLWTRSWNWSGSRVSIEDRLEGWAGTAQVEARLHFGEQDWRASSRDRFTTADCVLCIGAPPELSAELVRMAHSTDYGVVVNGQGILLRGRVALPVTWNWSFEFEANGRDDLSSQSRVESSLTAALRRGDRR